MKLAKYHAEYYNQNRDKINRQREKYQKSVKGQTSHRRNWLRSKYGLTLEQHKQIYLDQDGYCALCGKSVAYNRIATDHNHNTGKMRGLLCYPCNLGLGCLGDTVGGLRKAIKYLKKHKK